jgi:L-alanine-DL-glutamate epimerase-like enolase superfamily enzyme
MKITDIRTIQLSYRAANPSMSAASFNAARNALIVEIKTDTGLTGIAEAGSAGGPPASKGSLRSMCFGNIVRPSPRRLSVV